ncbi:MAG: kelch repeat-containing protein, partial [Candidatus Kapaibacterium sp.]
MTKILLVCIGSVFSLFDASFALAQSNHRNSYSTESDIGAWVAKSSSGFTARTGVSVVAVNGKIYALGGFDGSRFTSTVQIYDPATDSWSAPTTTGTFTPRADMAAASVGDKIYAMGGYNSSGSSLDTMEVFNTTSNAWSSGSATGKFTASDGAACVSMGNKIYVIAGEQDVTFLNRLEVFDPATNQWSTPVSSGTLT